MKKNLIFVLLLCLALCLAACGTGQSADDKADIAAGSVENNEVLAEDIVTPIYAEQLQEGTYPITVDSCSSMFRVINCELIVEYDAMKAVMTMSGDGYGMVYMGTGEEALLASEEAYVPFVLDEQGAKTFTVPVEALDMELDCAAWSIKKEKWYDRTLVFQSDELPADALIAE